MSRIDTQGDHSTEPRGGKRKVYYRIIRQTAPFHPDSPTNEQATSDTQSVRAPFCRYNPRFPLHFRPVDTVNNDQ